MRCRGRHFLGVWMSKFYDDLDELPAPPRKEIPAADRELLELAARAIGAQFEEVDGEGYGNLHFEDGSTVYSWNSLQFSGDALELAVQLRLEIRPDADKVTAAGNGVWEEVQAGGDRLSATRLAIVRAAAEIGKAI